MKRLLFAFLLWVSGGSIAQTQKVVFSPEKNSNIIHVSIGGKHFTDFFFPDTIAKPVLYPIKAPNGTVITRGFPVTPVAGEPTDHPHHLGLWFNFGDVNGLDFWNNSFAIPEDKKHLYGSVKLVGITENKGGEQGKLGYKAIWNDHQNNTLLNESTQFVFSEKNGSWIIDRTTTLTAKITVVFKDNKEGVLGLRMAHELQIPTIETKKFKDANGIETVIKAVTDTIANGNYLNSNGLTGDDVWGKRATWCMMHGKMKSASISVLMIDHPKNEVYPTYWHARGYGLFAANPMGSSVFNKNNPVYQRTLQPGESMTFRFRVVIASGNQRMDNASIEALEKDFAQR
ncbi:MAG: hypothetical protein RLZZ45_245 [Bacteroidota bacterium]|jgi:hypothetical protein